MGKSKIKGKDLRKINFKSNKSKSLAINIMSQEFKHINKEEKLKLLESVLVKPGEYLNDPILSPLAQEIVGKIEKKTGFEYHLNDEEKIFKAYGKREINENTFRQMEVAMQLPVTISGALMADAHVGYGLPIGGVLATENAVIPYGVGLDIGCRMSLSIYQVPDNFIERYKYQIKNALNKCTHFGIGNVVFNDVEHEVMDRGEFKDIELLKKLHSKAYNQLGTSGSGNHFVEFGTVELVENNKTGLKAGNYLGILAHSGSRGLGASIAEHYTRIAIQKCLLPQGAKHLTWLDLNNQEGQEYWIAMNLAGDYAKASHDVIHYKLAKALGIKKVAFIENHHNFAWKEKICNKEVVIHRKGAIPAYKDQLGIIPANMVDPGYIVSGKGNSDSLFSASHGAGRKMSRQKAKSSITGSELRKMLKSNKVCLIGGCRDEAPMAYKNLEKVIGAQSDLINIEGKFFPKIVRMDKN